VYRAVDKDSHTIDFLLTAHQDKEATLRFLKKASRRNGLLETITMDGSEASAVASRTYNEGYGIAITIRQANI
jgi:transposase-like protein